MKRHRAAKVKFRQKKPAAKRTSRPAARRKRAAPGRTLRWPYAETIGAVMSVKDEPETIGKVLRQLRRIPFHEVIVLANGSSEPTFRALRNERKLTLVHFDGPLGHDVGRALGAKLAEADILLFLDADIVIPAEKLLRFLKAVHAGGDVVLNDISPYIGRFSSRDSVTRAKEFLNRILQRPDLKSNSLTAVPHALSRRALEAIGYHNLTVPPKAHAIAVSKGLAVAAPLSVNVIARNKRRRRNSGISNPVEDLILGDTLEAVAMLQEQNGERLRFADALRNREAAGGEENG